MNRRGITSNQRARIFLDAKGICHICSIRIQAESGERWDVEHRKPLWLGGEDDESNMAPAHIHCHRVKSADEAPKRAKSDRIRNRHLGIKPDRTIRAWRKLDRDRTPVFKSRER